MTVAMDEKLRCNDLPMVSPIEAAAWRAAADDLGLNVEVRETAVVVRDF